MNLRNVRRFGASASAMLGDPLVSKAQARKRLLKTRGPTWHGLNRLRSVRPEISNSSQVVFDARSMQYVTGSSFGQYSP